MVPPSGNVMRRKYRNPHAYARLRDSWMRTMWVLAKRSSFEEGKATVHIHVEHGRLYDEDNLIAGCKPILDSLKGLCYIRDDSPEFLELVVTQEKSRERQTTIEVTPCQ
jgi:hypothetical protein